MVLRSGSQRSSAPLGSARKRTRRKGKSIKTLSRDFLIQPVVEAWVEERRCSPTSLQQGLKKKMYKKEELASLGSIQAGEDPPTCMG